MLGLVGFCWKFVGFCWTSFGDALLGVAARPQGPPRPPPGPRPSGEVVAEESRSLSHPGSSIVSRGLVTKSATNFEIRWISHEILVCTLYCVQDSGQRGSGRGTGSRACPRPLPSCAEQPACPASQGVALQQPACRRVSAKPRAPYSGEPAARRMRISTMRAWPHPTPTWPARYHPHPARPGTAPALLTRAPRCAI